MNEAATFDITPHVLELMRRQTPYPDLLDSLVALSRQNFGWFPKHASRALEYPWLAFRLREAGKVILDVGAGVSPLPLYLAQRGKTVVTVDLSDRIVDPGNLRNNNSWGFLDYKRISPTIRSYNVDVADLDLDVRLDAVYSASVIEHMPAVTRRSMLDNIARLSAPQSDILFTVDLFSGSMNLWNRDRGQEVESVDMHGTLQDLVAEVEVHGYETRYLEILRRGIESSNTAGDIALLHFVRR